MSRSYEFPEEAGLEAAKAHCEELNQQLERATALSIHWKDKFLEAKMLLQQVASDDSSRYNRPMYYYKVVDFLNKLK